MARRKIFKFKLNKKQKKFLTTLGMIALCVGVGLWLFRPPAEMGARKMHKKVFHRQTGRPKIVFVIDDIGNHNRYSAQLKALGNTVTYAILPLLPYSRYYGNLSRTTDAEVILHLPLDTVQDKIPGRGLIVDTMSPADILGMLSRDLNSVPHHVGVNNHMGSRGTASREMMTIILKELKRRGLFFLDSYTTPESVVPSVGRAIGLPILARGVFLDNEDSKPAIRAQINQLRTVAREKKNAIAIGHYRANTLEVLAKEIPRLEKEGFEIITLKEMLKVQRD
ncbi:MAG: divergent polysaccharide deacetylase family protein [Candidatus Omnitrophica bacterium]|nr:divergent polysaccharide deacetylase family protein [Candidatus Omnitrophota bacterium]